MSFKDTITDTIIPIVVLSLIGSFFILSVFCGNHYYTHSGVDREIRKFDPSIVMIQEMHRSVFEGTDIEVKHQDGRVRRLCLDSDITFSYEFYRPRNGVFCGMPPIKPSLPDYSSTF